MKGNKQHRNKHTFPKDIAEMIKPKPGMGPVFDSDSKHLMQKLREARELIESGNLTEEESAEDEIKDIRNRALFDLERGKSLNDLIKAYQNEKRNL